MSSYKKYGIVVLGSSKKIIKTRKRFLEYLDSLVDGRWIAEFGKYTHGVLTYLRYTEGSVLTCKEAQILLLTYNGELMAELHVNDADIYHTPIVTHHSTHAYRMGYPIKKNKEGKPLIVIFKNKLKVSDLYGIEGFPGSVRGGSYVHPIALEYIMR